MVRACNQLLSVFKYVDNILLIIMLLEGWQDPECWSCLRFCTFWPTSTHFFHLIHGEAWSLSHGIMELWNGPGTDSVGTAVSLDPMSVVLGLWSPGTGILRNWPIANHEEQAWTLGLLESRDVGISLELGRCLIKLQTSDLQPGLKCGCGKSIAWVLEVEFGPKSPKFLGMWLEEVVQLAHC